jgi:lipopolysaccharide export system protein LptA
MHIYSVHNKSIIIFIIFVTLLFGKNVDEFTRSKNKSKLELIHADYIRGVPYQNKTLKVWEGDVYVRQDSLELFCQRATYDDEENKIDLSGSVRLIQGKDTLLTKYLTYFENKKLAIAKKDVQVYRPHHFLSSDHLEYYYDTDRIIATGNLHIWDNERQVSVSAERGEYLPDEEITYAEMNVHLWQIDSSLTDTLHIFCKRLEYHTGEERKAIALDSVRILHDNIYAIGDSAVFFLDDQIAYLEINPRAIQENNEMFGEQIILYMKELEIDKIQVTGKAQAISVEDSLLGRENRLEGKEIVMFISKKKLNEIRAISNAKSLYYLKEEDSNIGRNVASADTIKAYFQNNELDSIVVIGGSQGIFYPKDFDGTVEM